MIKRLRNLSSILLLTALAGQAQTVGGFFAKEKLIWTAPLRMNQRQWGWVALAGAGTAALIAADASMSDSLPNGPAQLRWGRRLSRVGGSYGLFALSGAVFAAGAIQGDSKLKRTGFLAGESALHAIILTYGLKLATTRERPGLGSGRGHFYSGFEDTLAGDNSFPSGHSMASWAVATAITRHYPHKKYLPWLAYGLASMVSVSRVSARRHYVSDVAVGAGLGYLIGRLVENRYR